MKDPCIVCLAMPGSGGCQPRETAIAASLGPGAA